ncbi:hypothetical protein GCM10007291_42090 [Gemmobacter nanjingensis]|uniref:Glycosyltransferase 2-like domain-containing protein n=1 Tax=Gemmobacter nanjingensis TaxID=488454 RepID=A0ABQ3FSW3_9RHOB|nr:glycosyltransferase [Gemmobacter nanjingensis]GHC36228.1 hypothetical protein GCM10007291_42090 [Gemmobacter nanjingensis]
MTFTFILASHNVLPGIDDCLAAIRHCARPGDSLVVVDDGSTDGTGEYLDRLARIGALGLPCRIVLLGAHSCSGPALAFRLGIEQARQIPDSGAIVLVDGGGQLDPAGFAAARAHFERYEPDILYANYAVLDPVIAEVLRPQDGAAWGRIHAAPHAGTEAARTMALALEPAPWRAIYRSGFLGGMASGVSAGTGRQEDAVFHWETCLAARSFAFLDRRICFHRAGRAAAGAEASGDGFAAFTRISALLASGRAFAWEHPFAADAVVWLLTGLGRELERLEFTRCRVHAEQACAALGAIPGAIWALACDRLGAGHPIVPVGNMIRSASPADVAAHWELLALRRETQAALGTLCDLGERIAGQSATALRLLQTLSEIERFSALSEMLPRRKGKT